MQVCSSVDVEDIIQSVTSGLQNCAVAIYNVESYSIGSKIEALCIACGAMCSHIFMVTSVLQSTSGRERQKKTSQNGESKCKVGVCYF